MMTAYWLLPTVVGLSLVLTWLTRRYALAQQIIDRPNERSSHVVPTPRGGGIAIVVAFLTGLAVIWSLDMMSTGSFVAMTGAVGLVAAIGFIDDHSSLSRRWRFLAHFVAAAWALYWLRGLPAIPLGGLYLSAGWLSTMLAGIYLVWLVNLYNFMDGIDGIASIEAITVCCGGMLMYALAAPHGVPWPIVALPSALSAAAVAGFLYWNYPPARIFMGDVGSGSLGMLLGILSILAAWSEPQLFWAWIALLGVFVVDATTTLIRRMSMGGRAYLEAHRTHAYQHAALRCKSHRPVSLAVGLINVVWLYPWGALIALGRINGLLGVTIAYVPLVVLAIYLRAGKV